jgi:ParB family chromosome partitioning protein
MRLAIAAGLEEIEILVVDAANDNGAMRSMVENSVREVLNPVDQWRGIERLVALGWTEEAIALALALPVRQIRKLRPLANVLPAMLEQMRLGDMPSEQQLRIVAAAGQIDQKEVWKAHKPKKGDTAPWWQIANALTKKRMHAGMRASVTIWLKPTGSSGSKTSSRRLTRTVATPPMSKAFSGPSMSG